MKKKLIYGIFIIFICCYCFLSCKIARTKNEEALLIYGQICGETEKKENVKYIYNGILAEDYIERQNAFTPTVLIENSSKGYKVFLEAGQSYKMKTGDCLFLGNREEMEIVELGSKAKTEKKGEGRSTPREKVLQENGVFLKYEGKNEIFLCRSGRNKLYISYF